MNALVPSRVIEGELLEPGKLLAVVAAMHPLKMSSELVFVPVGASVAEIVERCATTCGVPKLTSGAVVKIDGHEILPALWSRVRPKDNAHVSVRAIAGRGVGGILRSVLQIALIAVASFIVGPGALALSGFAATAVSAGLVLGGSLLLGALFPPTSTKAQEARPQYSISSRRNESHRWGPIPVLFGHHRIAPKFATSPYTEIVGEDQFLYQLFVFGIGPLKIEDIRIGDTPIGEYQDVQIEVREGRAGEAPITLIPSQVIQDDFQIEPLQGRPVTRDAADGAETIGLDFVCPQGIGNVRKKDGSLERLSVSFQIDVVNRTTGAVAASQPYVIQGATRDPQRRTHRIAVPKGRYLVRVTRTSPDNSGDDHIQQVSWTALRSYRNEPVMSPAVPMAAVAVRIRASKQLSGPIGDLTAVCTRYARSWVGGQWVAEAPTRSPADAFRYVLQGPAMARPQGDQMLDLPAIESWADRCAQAGWSFDLYKDFDSSVPQTLHDICAAGRAVPIKRDGKWSVAMEDENAPVRELFSPRNVEGFVRSITFSLVPHVLRCKFVNERKNWVEDELLVYNDGYDRTNATLQQEVEFPGITNPDLIFRQARYRLAEMALRASVYRFNTDGAQLALARGDRVKASHYVVQGASMQGRILAVEGQIVTLDTSVSMEAGVSYAIETRRVLPIATIVATNPVTTVPGTTRQITLSGALPKPGDHFAFGEPTRISGTYRILRLTPLRDLRADIEMVDDAPGIQSADHGPIQHDGGLVVPPPALASYRPRALRIIEQLEDRPSGRIHVARLTWEMLPPPSLSIASFTVIALGEDGAEKRISVGPDERSADFETLQSGQWTFRVVAYFHGVGVSNLSDPLTVGINIPWDQLGIGLGNVQPDIRYIFEGAVEDRKHVDKLVDEFAALATANLTDLELEALRLNSRTFDLGADIEETGARLTEETIIRESENEALAARAVRVETRLDDPETGLSAQSVALDALTARTSKVEGGLVTAAESLRGVRAEIADIDAGLEASGQAIDVLGTTVRQQGDTITSESRKLTQVTSRLTNAEDDIDVVASSMSNLRTTVTQQGNRITSEAERTDGVVTRVGTAEGNIQGQATALSNLNTRVESVAGSLNAVAERAEDTRVRADNASAGALMRIQTRAGPAGTAVRHSYQYRRSLANEAYQESGWFVDLSDNGPPTIVFDFSRFIITDSTNSKAAPFRFQDGTLFSNALVVATAIVGQLRVGQIEARSIRTEELAIGGVQTGNVAGGAISAAGAGTGNRDLDVGVAVDGGFVLLNVTMDFNRIQSGSNSAPNTSWSLFRNGAQIAQGTINVGNAPSGDNLRWFGSRSIQLTDSAPPGWNVYALRCQEGTGAVSISALNLKR